MTQRVAEEVSATILRVSDLAVRIGSPTGAIHPVRGVSFTLRRGERLGIVGESGSGKSMTAKAIIGLLPEGAKVESGTVELGATELTQLSDREMSAIRGSKISLVYQNPLTALDPIRTIGQQLVEAIRAGGRHSKHQASEMATDLLHEVALPDPAGHMRRYPHELSGGMRQRVCIAMALGGEPDILIADEATTALDATTQAKILALLDRVVEQRGLSVLLITHDMGVASRFCETIQVMYAGRIVERAAAAGFFQRPLHPYAKALLRSMCRLDADPELPLQTMPGSPMGARPGIRGCAFAPRCPSVMEQCHTTDPRIAHVTAEHEVACLLVTDLAAERRANA